MRISRALWVVALAAVLVAGAAPAQAEDYMQAVSRAAKFAKARNYPKALEAFGDAVRADPSQIDAYVNAGNIAKHLDRCREILMFFRGFLYLSPQDPEVKMARAAIATCEAKTVGTLIVKTEVPGIEAKLDGGLVGRTPVADLKLLPGTYNLELSHPDWELASETVTITAGAITETKVELKHKLLFGYLEVITNPPEGVQVSLDDVGVATTPMKEKVRLETKKYLLRLEKPGYDRWIRSISIERDRVNKVQATLEPSAPTGVPAPTGK